LLVVIGILIALQINNWNTSRINKKQEIFYLNKLRLNIEEDTTYISIRLSQINLAIQQLDSLKELIENRDNNELTYNDWVLKLLSTYRFTPQSSTFQNLISTGKLDLITNQTFVDSLFVYYNDLNNYTTQINESVETYSRNTIGPYLMQFDLVYDKPSKKPFEYGEDVFIKNAIGYKSRQIKFIKKNYEFNRERAGRLIEMTKGNN